MLRLLTDFSYLPIWFQAIEGVSAVESGIRTIPLVLALVVGAISAGQLTGRIGYYTPFMFVSACIMPIGAGLITTFGLHTSEGIWIGYQIIAGFGMGMGMQQGALAAQTVLNKKDVPTGVSLMFFCQMLGGAIFVSVGQNVFDSNLVKGLTSIVHGLDPSEIVNTGATDLRNIVPANDLQGVLVAYNAALRKAFIVATVMAGVSIFGAALVRWRSVKGVAGPGGNRPASKDLQKPAVEAEEKV